MGHVHVFHKLQSWFQTFLELFCLLFTRLFTVLSGCFLRILAFCCSSKTGMLV